MSNPDAQRESGGATGGGSGGGTPLDPELRAEVQEWLRWAYEDLRGAEEATRHGERLMPRHACFLAEQCAEKAIKALLVLDSIPFPRNHDLNALRGLLPPRWQIATAPIQLTQLAIWAVAARYPGNL